jgi:hypothetical protein
MYKFTFTDKQRKQTHVLTFTSVDMFAAELQLNVLRDTYNLPEFTELQDGSFITENNTHRFILEEIETINETEENENTYF